jgi:hypothetical protein
MLLVRELYARQRVGEELGRGNGRATIGEIAQFLAATGVWVGEQGGPGAGRSELDGANWLERRPGSLAILDFWGETCLDVRQPTATCASTDVHSPARLTVINIVFSTSCVLVYRIYAAAFGLSVFAACSALAVPSCLQLEKRHAFVTPDKPRGNRMCWAMF